MGQRSSKKADITTPVKTKNSKVKRRKSKKDANGSTGGVEEVSIQEKKDDAELISAEQVGDGVPKVEAEASKKGETDSTGSGNAPTEIVEDSPGKETSKIAQLSEVQSPSEPSTSPVEVKSPEEKDSNQSKTVVSEAPQQKPSAEVEPKPVSEVKEPEIIGDVKVAESEPIAETKAEPESATEVKPEPESIVETKVELVVEAAPTSPEPVSEAKIESPVEVPEPVTEVKVESPVEVPEPVVETKVESPVEVPEPIVETKVESPVLEQVVEAKVESPTEVPEVIAEVSSLPEPIPEPIAEAVQEPVVESTPEISTAPDVATEVSQVTVVETQKEIQPEVEVQQSPIEAAVPEPVESNVEQIIEPVPSDVEKEVQSPVERLPELESNLINEETVNLNDLPEPIPEPIPEFKDEVAPVNELSPETKPDVVPETTQEISELAKNECEIIADNVANRNSANIVLTEAEMNLQSPTDNCNISESDRINGFTESNEVQVNGICPDAHNGEVQEKDTIINGVTGNGPSEIPTLIAWKHGGKEVAVCGDFCAWEDNCSLVENEGIFSTKIKLPKGQHHYKFFVDGNWTVDENAPVVELEGHGQVNLLVVAEGCE